MSQSYPYFLLLLAARTLVIAVVLVVGLKLGGKRHIGQMNVYDVAMIMAVANAVQNAMTSGTGDFTTGIVCGGTLLLFGRLMAAVFVNMPKIEEYYTGEPVILVQDGKMVPANLKRQCITEDNIMMALRSHGLGRIEDAHLIVLESDGSLSVVPRDQEASTA